MAYGIYIAEKALEDGVNYDLYICGMQPLEEFRSCHEIFQCEPSLSCVARVEADLYAISRPHMAAIDYVRDVPLCAMCACTSHDRCRGRSDRCGIEDCIFDGAPCVLHAKEMEPKLVLVGIFPIVKHS